MNPKQLACLLLMAVVGLITYVGQMVHKRVVGMKLSAEQAETDAKNAEGARQTAEIMAARTKADTEELRRFLQAWLPYIDKAQTEQEVESAIDVSLRDKGINLVRSRKSEAKSMRDNKIIPKTVLTTLVVEDEYAKIMNWMGDVERRVPVARVKTCQITGGGGPRLVKLDIALETPLFNLAEAAAPPPPKKK